VLRNRPGTFAALIAVLAGGNELVTLSPFHGDVRLAEDIRDLAPDVVVASEPDWSRPVVRGAVSEVGALGIDAGDGERALRLRGAGPATLRATAPPGDPVAVLMLTSGTTGRPKRVPLGYRKLTAAFAAAGTPTDGEGVRLHTRPTILWASLVHIGGLYFAVANVASGRPTALLEKFAVEPWAELVRTLRPALVGLPPAAMRMVLRSDLLASTFDGVRAATSGTAALPVEDADAFTARFGIPVLSVYGATEFAGAIAGWDLTLWEQWGEAKRGSVGRAHHGIELRIVDRETGEPLPAGERGVLEARGATTTATAPTAATSRPQRRVIEVPLHRVCRPKSKLRCELSQENTLSLFPTPPEGKRWRSSRSAISRRRSAPGAGRPSARRSTPCRSTWRRAARWRSSASPEPVSRPRAGWCCA
jgi:acyl-coenzyme A synthetase/AMP-(fatty) acid ligase